MLESRSSPDFAPTPGRVEAWPDLGRVRAVISGLPEAVLVTDRDGLLRLTNPAADRLFSTHPIRDRADLLSRFEPVATGSTSDRTAPRNRPSALSGVVVRPRHEPNRWYSLQTVPLDEDGAPASDDRAGREDVRGRMMFVLHDITDTREVRDEREAFLAVLSHELRTPITTIYAGSSVLANRPALSPPATRMLALDISAEAARLYDLVEDLLVLARLERRVLEPLDEPVLLHSAVEATIRTVKGRQPELPVEWRGARHAPAVHGDATYVEQACRDLVLGTIRHADPGPGGALVVELEHVPEDGEVAVRVLDQGPALSDEELERAFEIPDPTTITRSAGAGIGLFVCRHLVEAMGGRTWAANRPGGGVETGFALRVVEAA